MKYFWGGIVLCWGLSGCSSPGFRAPVADLTLSRSHHSSSNSTSTAKLASPARNSESYRVQKGDTLYAIAWKTDLDVKTLAERNNLKAPYIIYTGQLLNLKKKKHSKETQTEKGIVKSNAVSQKIDKKIPIRCTGQTCIKKVKNEVVHNKAKAYPALNLKKVASRKNTRKVQAKDKRIASWRWPAQGKLTESFSASKAGMKGISIANQRGTAIYAAADGQVVYAGSGLRGYGNLIIIKHNYDYLSAYAHNDKLLVREHEQIKGGQKIAIMGDSGTDNVHLHFEIRYRGKSVDPLRYLQKR